MEPNRIKEEIENAIEQYCNMYDWDVIRYLIIDSEPYIGLGYSEFLKLKKISIDDVQENTAKVAIVIDDETKDLNIGELTEIVYGIFNKLKLNVNRVQDGYFYCTGNSGDVRLDLTWIPMK